MICFEVWSCFCFSFSVEDEIFLKNGFKVLFETDFRSSLTRRSTATAFSSVCLLKILFFSSYSIQFIQNSAVFNFNPSRARARASKLHSSIGRPTDSHCARPAQFPLYRRRARACLLHGTSDSCSSRPSTHAKNKGEERKTWNSCFYPTAPKSGTGRPVENLLDGVCRNCGKQ